MVQARAAGVLLKPDSIDRGRALLIDAAERSTDPFETFFIARGMVYAGSSLNAPELLERGVDFMQRVTHEHPDLYVIGHDYARTLYSVGRTEEGLAEMIRVAKADSTNPVLASRVVDLARSMNRPELVEHWERERDRRAGVGD